MDRAQKLIQRITANAGNPGVESLTNELLKEFQRGYNLENLLTLLRSEDAQVVAAGAWIASELGEGGKSLLSEMYALLQHSAKNVRFFAIDCILLWASPFNRRELGSVVALMEDPEAAVRWKVMDFLSAASDEQLGSALHYLEITKPESIHVNGLRWLIGSNRSDSGEVISTLESRDPFLRKYGVVAATRTFRRDSEPLRRAAASDDSDVRRFADSMLNLHRSDRST